MESGKERWPTFHDVSEMLIDGAACRSITALYSACCAFPALTLSSIRTFLLDCTDDEAGQQDGWMEASIGGALPWSATSRQPITIHQLLSSLDLSLSSVPSQISCRSLRCDAITTTDSLDSLPRSRRLSGRQ